MHRHILKVSCQLIFHSPGSHITRQTALSTHCHLSALKVLIRLTAPTSFAIFIRGTPAGPVMCCDGKLFAYIWNHCSWRLGWGWGETFIREKGQWSKMLRQLVGQWVTATKNLAAATKQLNVTSSKRPTGSFLLIHSHMQTQSLDKQFPAPHALEMNL